METVIKNLNLGKEKLIFCGYSILRQEEIVFTKQELQKAAANFNREHGIRISVQEIGLHSID